MRQVFRQLFHFAFVFIFKEVRTRVVRQAKIKSLQVYLKTLQVTRLSASAIVALLFAIQLTVVGLVSVIGASLYLAPWTSEVKAYVALGVGAAFFLLPLSLLLFGLSGRTWYRYSGAEEMMNDLMGESEG